MTGKELKKLISELGITQQSIADSCNVSRITLLKWLNRYDIAPGIETRIKEAIITALSFIIDALETEIHSEVYKRTSKIKTLRKLQKKLRK